MHFGVILPNYGPDATPDAIRRIAELAEELGFDSVWATEHIIVGPEAVDPYGRVYDPLVTLGWIVGWTERSARHLDRARATAQSDAPCEGGREAAGALERRRHARRRHGLAQTRARPHGR